MTTRSLRARTLSARIDEPAIDPATGEFPMTLATDGEASDGDILSIEGASWPDRAPLQNAHVNDAKATLGSIYGFARDLRTTPKRLRAFGQIELGGEGAQAEIRRDVALMIGKGHLRGVSVRWNPLKWTRRVNLPSDHFAYIDDASEKDWRRRAGLFYERWTVLEGSIAPVQADREAVIGRAAETSGAVRAFWRSLAADAEAQPPSEDVQVLEALESALRSWEPPMGPLEIASVFAERLDAQAAATAELFDLYLRWARGSLLTTEERERVRPLRERVEAARRPRRFGDVAGTVLVGLGEDS